jgi:DNA-binding NarL/FixJ family response regulator
MLKDAPPEQIRRAVLDAAAGARVLAPGVEARIERTRLEDALSDRELELLALLAGGASNRQLAKSLFISEATVKTHLVHIYAKLGVENRTAAIAEARRRRIIRA